MITARIEVIDIAPNGLLRDVWKFYFEGDQRTLWLDHYSHQKRPTKRHGWKIEQGQHYERTDRRHLGADMDKSPPIPQDVKERALAQLIATLRCDVWENRNR